MSRKERFQDTFPRLLLKLPQHDVPSLTLTSSLPHKDSTGPEHHEKSINKDEYRRAPDDPNSIHRNLLGTKRERRRFDVSARTQTGTRDGVLLYRRE